MEPSGSMDQPQQQPMESAEAAVFSTPSQSQYGFSGVFLLTNSQDGPTAVPNLELDLVPEGLSLSKDDGTVVWTTAWEDVAYIDTPERCRLPNDEHGVVLVVAPRSGKPHRFVVPAGNPEALEIALDAMAEEFGVALSPQRSSPKLAAGIIGTLAGIALVLLLFAGHVI